MPFFNVVESSPENDPSICCSIHFIFRVNNEHKTNPGKGGSIRNVTTISWLTTDYHLKYYTVTFEIFEKFDSNACSPKPHSYYSPANVNRPLEALLDFHSDRVFSPRRAADENCSASISRLYHTGITYFITKPCSRCETAHLRATSTASIQVYKYEIYLNNQFTIT